VEVDKEQIVADNRNMYVSKQHYLCATCKDILRRNNFSQGYWDAIPSPTPDPHQDHDDLQWEVAQDHFGKKIRTMYGETYQQVTMPFDQLWYTKCERRPDGVLRWPGSRFDRTTEGDLVIWTPYVVIPQEQSIPITRNSKTRIRLQFKTVGIHSHHEGKLNDANGDAYALTHDVLQHEWQAPIEFVEVPPERRYEYINREHDHFTLECPHCNNGYVDDVWPLPTLCTTCDNQGNELPLMECKNCTQWYCPVCHEREEPEFNWREVATQARITVERNIENTFMGPYGDILEPFDPDSPEAAV